jgi:hypothetical protein
MWLCPKMLRTVYPPNKWLRKNGQHDEKPMDGFRGTLLTDPPDDHPRTVFGELGLGMVDSRISKLIGNHQTGTGWLSCIQKLEGGGWALFVTLVWSK